MSTDVLLGFGDSWAVGSELNEGEKPYLNLLAQQLGVPCINFAITSSSVPHLILQFQQFCDTQFYPTRRYHAIFFLTAQERTFFYNDNKEIVHCSPQEAEFDYKREPKIYYQLYTHEIGNFHFNATLLALQKLCYEYKINDYYVLGWQKSKLWRSVDTTKFFKQGNQTITDLFHDSEHKPLSTLIKEKNQYIWPNYGHPNQQGHELIARALGDWISVH